MKRKKKKKLRIGNGGQQGQNKTKIEQINKKQQYHMLITHFEN